MTSEVWCSKCERTAAGEYHQPDGTTMALCEQHAPKAERVVAEKDGDGWLVMWPDGNVAFYPTKPAVLAAVKARIGNAAILVTRLEWRS